MLRSLSLWMVLTAAATAAAQPADTNFVHPLLARAVREAGHQRYTGVRLVQLRRRPKAATHEEYVSRDGAKIRIEFADDSPFAGQIIVEDGRTRRHFLPQMNEIRVLPPRRDEALLRVGRALQRGGMQISSTDGGQIAGRRTTLFAIADPQGNVTQRIYVDVETALVLKRVLFDPVGTQIGYFEFTKVSYPAQLSPKLFALVRKGAVIVTPDDELARECQSGGFNRIRIPDRLGYRLEGVRSMRMQGENVLAQTYSTDHGKLSFFQVRALIPAERLWAMRRGEVHIAVWQANGSTYALMGPQDQAELDGLAKRLSTENPKL
jgi:outer membrane lipoprotein-sorting protein